MRVCRNNIVFSAEALECLGPLPGALDTACNRTVCDRMSVRELRLSRILGGKLSSRQFPRANGSDSVVASVCNQKFDGVSRETPDLEMCSFIGQAPLTVRGFANLSEKT